MPDFNFTSPEGKSYTVSGPEGATKEQAFGILQGQLAGAPKADPKAVPDSPPAQGKSGQPDAILAEKVEGGLEAGLSMASAATTGLLGRAGATLGGIAGQIAQGELGSPAGAARAAQGAEEGAQKLTYTPPGAKGRDYMDSIREIISASKIEGLGPVFAQEIAGTPGRGTGSAKVAKEALKQEGEYAGMAARRGAEELRSATGSTVSDIKARLKAAAQKIVPPKAQPMSGMGAADTEQSAIRRGRAADLPVPIKLTKGQAERTFEQQQFERETAKNPQAGAPLRERFAEQNQQILQNFDAWLDQTGAEAVSLRATGEAVTEAVAAKAKDAKTKINAAYDQARRSGEMAEQVEVSPLLQYLAQHEPEAINAPVLSSAAAKVNQLAKDGKLSINDLEEVRKMVGKLGGRDATNATFAKEMKGQIDALTEGKGGEAYKRARALHREYVAEFKSVGVVDKLLSKKPGTSDRAVAYEDVFQHSVMSGSADDLRSIRKTLQTGGAKGEQAWRELQGAGVRHIKDEITKSVAPDINGNPMVSPAKLKNIITSLDKDGKLEVMFGKQGAQKLRDVTDLAQDVYTSPPGSVNSSNTASIIIGLMDTIVSGTTGVPLPIGSAINYGVKKVKERSLNKRVGEALQDPNDVINALSGNPVVNTLSP